MTSSQDDGYTSEEAQVHPAETVDALERKVLGEQAEQRRHEDDTDAPAYDQDVDEEELTRGSDSGAPQEPTD